VPAFCRYNDKAFSVGHVNQRRGSQCSALGSDVVEQEHGRHPGHVLTEKSTGGSIDRGVSAGERPDDAPERSITRISNSSGDTNTTHSCSGSTDTIARARMATKKRYPSVPFLATC